MMIRIACCLVALVVVAVLSGCGGKPMAFPIPESELGNQPGLFTGDKGAWEFHPGSSSSQTR